MSRESRTVAGVSPNVHPTVILGGVGLLSLSVFPVAHAANPLRQNLGSLVLGIGLVRFGAEGDR